MKTAFQKSEKLMESLSFLFSRIEPLPIYTDTQNPEKIIYVAITNTLPHENQQLRNIISELKSNIEFFKTRETDAIGFIYDDLRIVIYLTRNEQDFKWAKEHRSYFSAPILGKLLKKAGLKYSPAGLQYVQYDLRDNHKSLVGTLDITKDFERIIKLLGYDYERFIQGFKNQEEFFRYILTSPYIKVEKFLEPEGLGEVAIIDAFAQFLVENNITKTGFNKYKSFNFELVKQFFSEIDFDKELSILRERAEKKLNIAKKFNGKVILEKIPNFNQKHIGLALGRFKYSFGDVEIFKDFIVDNPVEVILEKFKEVNQIA
jgi:hypothetical protein